MTIDFGRDTHCELSYKSGRYATGLLLVAQNALHRLITTKGQLRGGEAERQYGLGIEDLLGQGPAVLASLPGRIHAQLTLDERITDVGTKITESTDGPVTSVVVEVTCQTHAGPFTLKLSAADGEVTTEILGYAEGT